MTRTWVIVFCSLVVISTLSVALYSGITHAQAESSSNFSLVVTPTPIVASVSPGKTTDLQLKVLNNGNATENLQIEPKGFTFTNNKVYLSDKPPQFPSSWVKFSQPKFSVDQGQWFNENVSISLPSSAGFSYSFALLISSQNAPAFGHGRLINGSVADFVLLNVNKPGATIKLEASSFSSTKHIYEWLPSTFNVTFNNIGNSIAQPFGNIFISRKPYTKTPIDTLAVNPSGSYVLPGTKRTLSSSWGNGFPAYKSYTAADGSTAQHLVWNWANLADFRFGEYTANLVAAYNNGTSDVPIVSSITFWVVPWKVILVGLLLIAVMLFGLWTIFRRIAQTFSKKRKKKYHPTHGS